MLDKIGIEISGFSKMFPVEASLANFTIFLNQGQKNIESYYPQVDQMDFYRFVHVCVLIRLWEQKLSHYGDKLPIRGARIWPPKRLTIYFRVKVLGLKRLLLILLHNNNV